jgi:uncharacterized protein
MIVKLHQISDQPLQCDFELARNALLRVDERLTFPGMTCRAVLTKQCDAIRLQGFYSLEIATFCDLCLKPIQLNLAQQFELILVSEDDYCEPDGDTELSLNTNDVECYRGYEVSLLPFFEDQLLLDLPLVIKCDEFCQGLCPVCGTDLNQMTCTCKDTTDNPFSALKDE